MASVEIQYDATSVQAPPTDGAALDLLDGTNVDVYVRAFDDTTEEFVQGKFKVPSNIDLAGSVTFEALVTAKTAASGRFVKHRFSHVPVGNNEDFDISYSVKDSADQAINSNQNTILAQTWTETVSNLGWVVSDEVFFKYSRIPTASNGLVGDLLLLSLIIKIPVT